LTEILFEKIIAEITLELIKCHILSSDYAAEIYTEERILKIKEETRDTGTPVASTYTCLPHLMFNCFSTKGQLSLLDHSSPKQDRLTSAALLHTCAHLNHEPHRPAILTW
jgi:hypothetical protein